MTSTLDRRDFLRTAGGTLALLLSRGGLSAAQTPSTESPSGPPVTVGVVGLGAWGREVLSALGRISAARVDCICDVYEPFLKRAAAGAPRAHTVSEWLRVIEASVEAIIVATPTDAHREIAVAALEAGKHVYCEAPLAQTIQEARLIAGAARNASGVVFQAGLQGRSNALYAHVLQFVKSGVLGDVAIVNAQWGRKDSWRRSAPTPERERALNWRLLRSSPGIIGEAGIHQLDLIIRYLGARPTAITGTGATVAWRDGREVPDTVACLIEFDKSRANFRGTLASSFGGAYTAFQGSNSSLLLKEDRGWMIKEADSPLLGWEVYARKDVVHDDTGIALVADATKLLEAGREPGKDAPLEAVKPPLVLALESFVRSVRQNTAPAAGPREAYVSTVTALRANEAILGNARVEIRPEDYTF
jgi:predicted dehydrogenase